MKTVQRAALLAVERIADAARLKTLSEYELAELDSDAGLTIEETVDGVEIPVAVWLVDGEARAFTCCQLCDSEVWETAKVAKSTYFLVDACTDEILRVATAWETSMSLMVADATGGPGILRLDGLGPVYVREVIR